MSTIVAGAPSQINPHTTRDNSICLFVLTPYRDIIPHVLLPIWVSLHPQLANSVENQPHAHRIGP